MSSAFNFINMLNNLIKDKQQTEEIAGNTGCTAFRKQIGREQCVPDAGQQYE